MDLIMRCLQILAILVVAAVGGTQQTDTVVLLDTFDVDAVAPDIKIGAKSAITINIKARIAEGSDSLTGKNLWRVGIFGSEWPDGFGERYDYVDQILTKKQASKPIERMGTLKLKNLRSRFDLSQIGCGVVAYFCVELARNEQSSIDFELRAGSDLDSIVTCERLNCTRPHETPRAPADSSLDPGSNSLSGSFGGLRGRSMDTDLPPTCLQQCPSPELIGGPVCGNNSVQYDSFCEITKAARCQGVPVKIAHPGECPPAPSDKVRLMLGGFRWRFVVVNVCTDTPSVVSLNISVPVREDSQAITGGRNLWRIGLYGSSDPAGLSGEKLNYIPQMLHWFDSRNSPDIVPGRDFVFPIMQRRFEIEALGCEDTIYKYLCVVIEKNPDAEPDFEITNRANKTRMVSCHRRSCFTPETIMPYQQAAAMLRNGVSESFVVWLLSHMTKDSQLDFEEFKFNIASSNTEAPPVVVTPAPHLTTARVIDMEFGVTVLRPARDDGAYDITLEVTLATNPDTETVQGTGLWRIGVFLSNTPSGAMSKYQYQPDILTEEQKAIPLIQGQDLVLAPEVALNLEGVGCPGATLAYICVEFAQGAAPDPPFSPHLPTGTATLCRHLSCIRSRSN